LAELNLFQEKIFVNGFAIQCRVTREPGDDRGEITHYQEVFFLFLFFILKIQKEYLIVTFSRFLEMEFV